MDTLKISFIIESDGILGISLINLFIYFKNQVITHEVYLKKGQKMWIY